MVRSFNSRSAVVSIGLLLGMAGGAFWLTRISRGSQTATVTGVALVENKDPQKQVPIADAAVEIISGKSISRGKSDATGYFRVTMPRRTLGRRTYLSVKHADYAPLDNMEVPLDKIVVLRLTPIEKTKPLVAGGPQLAISNAKIRYTTKEEATVNIGSIVRSLPIPNVGNVPCGNGPTCSPDKKWKATVSKVSYDAGDDNHFINIRLSCVAGPCAFTRVESSNIEGAVRRIQISIRNWSDTATYLLEAEVRHTMVSEMVRRSFPAIFGNTMDFTLPASAEGLSIEADLNGTSIVFPLGPHLLLSWATCTGEKADGRTRLFRCELKPGFQFQ